MLKSLSLFTLALLLSFSILGPSFIALGTNEIDIELTQDFDEESQKEGKKEIDEKEKFFENFEVISSEPLCEKGILVPFYLQKSYGWSPETHSPPPQHLS